MTDEQKSRFAADRVAAEAKKKSIGKLLQKISSGLSVINELIADGEKALHPTDRFGDYAVRLSRLKLVL
jgi:hypothetical protein